MAALSIGAACTSCALILGYGDPAELAAPRDDGGGAGMPDVVGVDASARDASGPFCPSLSPTPTFCTSFDEASYLAGWSGSDLVNGVISRDTSTFTSSPASLRAAFAPQGAGSTVNANVSLDVPGFDAKPFTATLAFDVRVEAAAPQGAFAVIANALVVAGPGAPTFILQVIATPLPDGTSAALSLLEVLPGGGTTTHSALQSISMARWSRVEITTTIGSRGTTGNDVKLLVDGKNAFTGPIVQEIGTGGPGVTLGLSAVADNTTAWSLRYDNVTIDMH
jgi:hypothetical protein